MNRNRIRIGYLGPPGTFTEEALRSLSIEPQPEYVALPSIAEVLSAVQSGEVDKGIVPVENSIEGTVNVTTDMLIFEVDVKIEREVVLPVDHNLLARPGVSLSEIDTVYSLPHATAQCRRFLSEKLPGIQTAATNSTADAAKLVSQQFPKGAAIATKLAAELYGLEVLAPDIQDVKANATRFIIVGRELPPPTGADKTSIVCFIHEDRPGSLLEILEQFSDRSINLTKVESRPTKQRLGEYCFLIDLEGHARDADVSSALVSLEELLPHVKVLGSYPKWQGRL